MIPALNISQAGILAAADRIGARAADIAASTPTDPIGTATQNPSGQRPPVVRHLPLPANSVEATDLTEQITGLIEDEAALKLNAVVYRTAAEVARALYEELD